MADETSPWRGRRVLVTGCTGFLGGAVTRELCALGAEVVGLVREGAVPVAGVRIVRGRADNVFRLHSAMAVHEVAAVFHLAAVDPAAVLQAAKLYAPRVPVVTARRIAQIAPAHADGERLSVARFGAVFGPGDRKPARPDGPATDWVFVRDAARALVRVAEAVAAHGPGNYTFQTGWRLADGRTTTPPANPLGWTPSLTFADALAETRAWELRQVGTVRRAA